MLNVQILYYQSKWFTKTIPHRAGKFKQRDHPQKELAEYNPDRLMSFLDLNLNFEILKTSHSYSVNCSKIKITANNWSTWFCCSWGKQLLVCNQLMLNFKMLICVFCHASCQGFGKRVHSIWIQFAIVIYRTWFVRISKIRE